MVTGDGLEARTDNRVLLPDVLRHLPPAPAGKASNRIPRVIGSRPPARQRVRKADIPALVDAEIEAQTAKLEERAEVAARKEALRCWNPPRSTGRRLVKHPLPIFVARRRDGSHARARRSPRSMRVASSSSDDPGGGSEEGDPDGSPISGQGNPHAELAGVRR